MSKHKNNPEILFYKTFKKYVLIAYANKQDPYVENFLHTLVHVIWYSVQ
jgi:hypothetical protein